MRKSGFAEPNLINLINRRSKAAKLSPADKIGDKFSLPRRKDAGKFALKRTKFTRLKAEF
ncbi:hypothetical protein CAMRE0001_1366 [Campylobacter rectus RM3267]|uniref:Uncharacterized protein n=1 Tax=Campylobacter rectus RM3267 TaxID=553218 RepID=B9D052_CAMRE|nr:hypothetical protein CAMRE0001_1366 [Campylobacter rectus RM3267]